MKEALRNIKARGEKWTTKDVTTTTPTATQNGMILNFLLGIMADAHLLPELPS